MIRADKRSRPYYSVRSRSQLQRNRLILYPRAFLPSSLNFWPSRFGESHKAERSVTRHGNGGLTSRSSESRKAVSRTPRSFGRAVLSASFCRAHGCETSAISGDDGERATALRRRWRRGGGVARESQRKTSVFHARGLRQLVKYACNRRDGGCEGERRGFSSDRLP